MGSSPLFSRGLADAVSPTLRLRSVFSFLATCLTLSGPSAFAKTAHHLSDFEGLEEPEQKYDVACGCFKPHEKFAHITEQEEGTFRMLLHFSPQTWDDDRTKKDKGRQRSEVKGLGPRQLPGETFEYASTWRTSPDFKASTRFCHIFQLKATDGDNGAPLVTQTLNEGGSGTIKLWSGEDKGAATLRSFKWTTGEWTAAKIRIKTSKQSDGLVVASYNSDAFAGKTGVSVYRPEASEYRPKWGLYRAVAHELPLADAYMEHRDVQANKITTSGP